jgi:hypothetical protein
VNLLAANCGLIGSTITRCRGVGPLIRVLLFAIALPLLPECVRAQQGALVEARVSGVRGHAVLTGASRSTPDLADGRVLSPGDQIDTRGGGRVTIELSDGSVVIVQPGSLVLLQDFRSASSLRELLRITVGRVRIRINHFGGRPNPYRVNSPTASIAVRGTEFTVAVAARGDTEVVVIDGLVEVVGVGRAGGRVFVEAGHGVIVRPNESIQPFIPRPSNEIGERTGKGQGHDETSDDIEGQVANKQPVGENLRTAAGVYERYFESVVETGEALLPSRYAAFSDPFFDTIDNPSYSTEFNNTAGRVILLPSAGGGRDREDVQSAFGFSDPRLVDYGITPQASLFVPLKRYKAVIGVRLSFSDDRFQSLTVQDNVDLTGTLFPNGTKGTRSVDGATTNKFFTGSLSIARRFGASSRTSIGVGLDFLRSSGTLSNTIVQSDSGGISTNEFVSSRSLANRTRLTFGLTQDLGHGHKLGLFYRYSAISGEDRERTRTVNREPRLLNRTDAAGNSSEIGLRLRGPVTRRLFYGIEGSYLFANIDESAKRLRVVDSVIRSRSERGSLGFGLGYVINPRTVLSFDIAGGIADIHDLRRERVTSNILEDDRKKASFVSLHAALQADVWRRLFVSGSLLSVTQSRITDLILYPDRFGRSITTGGMLSPNGQTRDRFTDYFSDSGVGWRFNKSLLVEYIFSTDFGQTSPRHTFLFRYTFNRPEK